jgi:hypothetical protein
MSFDNRAAVFRKLGFSVRRWLLWLRSLAIDVARSNGFRRPDPVISFSRDDA